MSYQFLSIDSIEQLHIEITNKCNAACPMCARNNNGFGLNPSMVLSDWEEGDATLVFSHELKNLKRVFFCGTHGDPIASSQLITAIKKCKERNLSVEIFTNGSLRSTTWWEELTKLLTEKDMIVFGIDGLETNHLYRQNTNIDKILHNLEICCKGVVKTQWDFLVFEHNEHELEKCKIKSLELGVDNFRIKKTARFKLDTFEVRNTENKITHYLKPPKNPLYKHPDFAIMQQISKKLPDQYNIECMYQAAKKMYVNSKLEVYPCCYIGDNRENGKINNILSELFVPFKDMNLRTKTWGEILSNDFFSNELVNSFDQPNRISRCVKTCGVVKREANQIHNE